MDPRRQRIEEVCDAALDRPVTERAAFVAAACGDDDALRRDVEALLAHEATADGFHTPPIRAAAADALIEAPRASYERIEGIFTKALELSQDARIAFLEEACEGDSLLKREIASLLNAATSSAGADPSPQEQPTLAFRGVTLGHYRIISPLGRGGMGEVFLAEDVCLGRRIALRVIESEPAESPRADRLLREARAASALNHPNIVTVYDIGESHAGRYIAMEFIPGSNLRSFIASRPAVEDVARVIAQVARALASAHAIGVIHRDIKPENIVLRDDGNVKVVDFGLARAPSLSVEGEAASGSGTITGLVVGTVHYMSPEQSVAGPVTGASDVYSLGVVLYEVLTGRRPIEAPSIISHIAALASQDVVAPSRYAPELPAVLDELALAMLDRRFDCRPTAEEVAARLDALTQDPLLRTRSGSRQRSSVGRDVERRALHSALGRVKDGRGYMLLVAGDAGVGKTTLVNDFLSDLRVDDPHALIAHGRCSERLAGTGGYLPIVEALHQFMGRSADTVTARLVKSMAPNWYEQIVSATELIENRPVPLPPAPE